MRRWRRLPKGAPLKWSSSQRKLVRKEAPFKGTSQTFDFRCFLTLIDVSLYKQQHLCSSRRCTSFFVHIHMRRWCRLPKEAPLKGSSSERKLLPEEAPSKRKLLSKEGPRASIFAAFWRLLMALYISSCICFLPGCVHLSLHTFVWDGGVAFQRKLLPKEAPPRGSPVQKEAPFKGRSQSFDFHCFFKLIGGSLH